MYASHKTEFHNCEPDEKTIVSMSVWIKNSKRLDALDNKGKLRLIKHLEAFSKRVLQSAEEVRETLTAG